MRIGFLSGCAALALAGAAPARDLPVPADKGWQHADSGVILTATLTGWPRTMLVDNGTDERDVIAEFGTASRDDVATVYIFHPALMNVGIWFDRAQTAISKRDVFGGATPIAPLPTPFALPGGTITTGLRQVYTPGRGKFRSTALAIAQTGTWLVAVRLSSTTLDPASADAKLVQIIAAIRWPAPKSNMIAAAPIESCAGGLSFHKAMVIKPDMTQALIGASMAASALKDAAKDAKPVRWCRDPAPAVVEYGVYRAIGLNDGYTLAIGDSGRTVAVHKGFTLVETLNKPYAVSLHDLDDSVTTFPSFDLLPEPEQVFAMAIGGRPPMAKTQSKNGKVSLTIAAPPK